MTSARPIWSRTRTGRRYEHGKVKLAITGGTGFVGSHLVKAALANSHRVTALARRPQSRKERLTWVEGDLADREALRHLVVGADAVIHVAGVLNAPEVKARLSSLGIEVTTGSPQALAQLIRDDYARWGKVVRATGMRAE